MQFTEMVFFLGGPLILSSVQLESTVAVASALAQREQDRRPIAIADLNSGCLAVSGLAAGGGTAAYDPEVGMMEVWRLLPNLKHLPESLLKKLSLEAVFQLNSALAKDMKSAAKLSVNVRLSQNARRIADNPVCVGAANDNRRDVLHPARFIRGASCPNSKLWLAARRMLGNKGITALGCYDMDSVGCGVCVTPKGWEALSAQPLFSGT